MPSITTGQVAIANLPSSQGWSCIEVGRYVYLQAAVEAGQRLHTRLALGRGLAGGHCKAQLGQQQLQRRPAPRVADLTPQGSPLHQRLVLACG